MKTTRTALPALLLTTGLATGLAGVGLVTPAHASGGDDGRVSANGTCQAQGRWKIKAKPDDGRIEVEAEIDSNASGQKWSWVLKHNGDKSGSGKATTTGRSGSFEVERKLFDGNGKDTFVFRATHGSSVCVATVTL